MKWSTNVQAFFLACALVQTVSEVHDVLSELKNTSDLHSFHQPRFRRLKTMFELERMCWGNLDTRV